MPLSFGTSPGATKRSDTLARLKSGGFDVFVIGGGATGVGTALDAARRGYSVALVDRGDWSEGTSSKSSNMHHGGVRYLQAFVNNPTGAEENLKVVKNGLQEQQYLYHCAPYLVQPCPIMVPCYSNREVESFGKLLAKYDELGEDDPYPSSHWCSKSEALFRFPQLKPGGLEGAWVYYDAEQDDARMGLLIALTAEAAGACAVNYVEVKDLVKDSNGKVTGVTCSDADGGANPEPFEVSAKVVINCCGPFCDAIRKMDQPDVGDIIKPAAGTHVVLPSHFSPADTGMAILETSDGRAMFYLPWQGRTLVGTTDYLTELTKWPTPPQKDIDFIIGEVNRFLSADACHATQKDVLAAWVGIRPLAAGTQSVTGTAATAAEGETAEDKGATKKVSREHTVGTSPSGVVTIAGGKWTSYRHMAEDAVDAAVISGGLPEKPKMKGLINLIGCKGKANEPAQQIKYANAAAFHRNLIELKEKYHIDAATAQMLNQSYGSLAFDVAEIGKLDKPLRKKISGQFPWILAQVVYAVRHEHARHVSDILSRRTRLCQVDVLAAHLATPKVIDVMAKELGWDAKRKEAEAARTEEFLKSCGLEMRLEAVKGDRSSQRKSLFQFLHGA